MFEDSNIDHGELDENIKRGKKKHKSITCLGWN